nr:Mediator of RNA polymerase II transcription subunit 13, putative [Ipomoea batatas]
MKRNQEDEPIEEDNTTSHHHNHEITKAAAQAWHARQSTSRPATSEFDARRLNFKAWPTRFAVEAMRKALTASNNEQLDYNNGAIISSIDARKWDFGESLWDYYEIVTVAKKLEVGLLLDHPFTSPLDEPIRIRKKKVHKEGKNSLRNLFSKISSKRFSGNDVPLD